MSERGVFAIDRGLLSHDRFAPEPFTEREAWIWMIGEAAFKPYSKRVGVIRVELRRGQLAHSLRFMAERWKWSETRVRRFLAKLKGSPPASDALIDAATDAGLTVVTICKYDAYQTLIMRLDGAADAAIDAAATQRRSLGSDIGGDGGNARAREPKFKIAKEAFEFADELARIAGHDLQNLPLRWMNDQPAVRVQMMFDAGWTIPVMRSEAIAAIRRKRDGPPFSVKYFEPIFARAHAPPLPLPAAQLVRSNEVPHAQTPAHSTDEWKARRDGWRRDHADLKAGIRAAESASDRGGEGGGSTVRPGAAAGRE